MRRLHVAAALIAVLLVGSSAFGADGKIRVLVFTGGHGFEKEKFFALFQGYPDVEHREVVYPEAAKSLDPEAAKASETLVMYDMFTGLDAKGKENFARVVRDGKPLVILHHAIASHQDWPEYEKILGGRFWTQPPAGESVSKAGWGAPIRARVADPDHPIVRGISEFEVADEWYGACKIGPKVQVLLATDHPENNKAIAWVHTYGQGRVAYIQLGHDDRVYSNPSYRRLIVQAVRWAAKRPVEGGGFQPLFNGKDLSGWKQEGGSVWTVEDGILAGKQGPNFAPGDLFTTAEFGDFELEVEFRAVWPCNSGVWFRYTKPSAAYQADILEWKNPVCWTGTLYAPGKMFISKNEDATLVDREGWNAFRIIAKGDHIAIYLNERKVSDVRDSSWARGRIGYQIHPGAEFGPMRILVRRCAIREIE